MSEASVDTLLDGYISYYALQAYSNFGGWMFSM